MAEKSAKQGYKPAVEAVNELNSPAQSQRLRPILLQPLNPSPA